MDSGRAGDTTTIVGGAGPDTIDGGPDDDADTTPNTLFATQGIFIP